MALPSLPIESPVIERLSRGSLLATASPINTKDPINGDRLVEERWLAGGVTWTPQTCADLYTLDVDPCSLNNLGAVVRDCDTALTATSFSVYDVLRGSPLEYEPEDLEAILRGRITTRASAAFAFELLSGSVSGDKSLKAVAHQPAKQTASASAPVAQTLAKLEDELSRSLKGQRGMIHLPPGMLALATTSYGVHVVDDHFETPLGNLVVADAGYAQPFVAGSFVNTSRPAYTAVSAGANTDWVYASGMVHYATTSVMMVDAGNIGSTMSINDATIDPVNTLAFKTRDRFTRMAVLYGLLVFDPCPVTAALATYENEDDA